MGRAARSQAALDPGLAQEEDQEGDQAALEELLVELPAEGSDERRPAPALAEEEEVDGQTQETQRLIRLAVDHAAGKKRVVRNPIIIRHKPSSQRCH